MSALLSSCREKLTEPISFFENYDLSSGRYRLDFYNIDGVAIDNFKNFYIDDPTTLLKIQLQWIFKYKSDIQPCGYGYSIELKENNKVIKQTLINLDCEYMSGWIHFPKEFLTDHKNHFKTLK
ncbi:MULTISPECIES: hypothetical protein [unclassified Chryseobacterium]|uniref:hypothetical protein n=1 Tax=unclassified Chryseobacterium TaxID=2593645 RepID=UPI001038C724|nr:MULTISPECIES: hypothetical protein [unclassified Chryseobacterium]